MPTGLWTSAPARATTADGSSSREHPPTSSPPGRPSPASTSRPTSAPDQFHFSGRRNPRSRRLELGERRLSLERIKGSTPVRQRDVEAVEFGCAIECPKKQLGVVDADAPGPRNLLRAFGHVLAHRESGRVFPTYWLIVALVALLGRVVDDEYFSEFAPLVV